MVTKYRSPEYREKQRIYMRERYHSGIRTDWKTRNRKTYLEQQRKAALNRRAQNPSSQEEKQLNVERVRAWRAANPQRHRDLSLKYLARKYSNHIEDVDRMVLLERDGGLCGICGSTVDPVNFHVDHIKPLSKGGAHSYANTQIAHPTCNIKKGAREI